jgi:large subunit ribosomal protein L1
MRKRSKRYKKLSEMIDKSKRYSAAEASELVKKCAGGKADQTVSLAVKLGVDPRHADQMIRGAVVLPHGTGKSKKVAVFCKGEKQNEARAAGADIVGAEDLVEQVSGGMLDFEVVIASPDMMGLVGRLGRVLGPRGLMPNPKTGTVTPDVAQAVRDAKGGKVEYRTEKAGIIQCPIGKASFEPKAIMGNLIAIIDALNRAKPASAKGIYMQSITVSTTHGPGIKVDPGDSAF